MEEVEAPEWQAVTGPVLHLHMYECMPQRYVTCFASNKCKSFGHVGVRDKQVCMCTFRIANWLSTKFQAKEAQQQVMSWTEKLIKCLTDIVQDVGRPSQKPYVEMAKNEINV